MSIAKIKKMGRRSPPLFEAAIKKLSRGLMRQIKEELEKLAITAKKKRSKTIITINPKPRKLPK